ncbi:hypothetical protein JDV02_009348 [Purpureocillium takamizusanense]|uniref:Uncharacterized protein n=1 Tax=Purpureocillium takamizusanense TaxID=2060973 RepID=A0A9Q8QLV6_9HYPO|nr:uncharacterized protein JDV02_009348 [Purpureocillium takamizusanense]UNI23529.1 hypothetical protein JDV02_009348 [Purpureocillium takamizusanense]
MVGSATYTDAEIAWILDQALAGTKASDIQNGFRRFGRGLSASQLRYVKGKYGRDPRFNSPLINRPIHPTTSVTETSPQGAPALPSTEALAATTPSLPPARAPTPTYAAVIYTGPNSVPPRVLLPPETAIPPQLAGVRRPREDEDASVRAIQEQSGAKRQRLEGQQDIATTAQSVDNSKNTAHYTNEDLVRMLSHPSVYNTPQYHAHRFQAGYMPVDPSMTVNMSPSIGFSMSANPQIRPHQQSSTVPSPGVAGSSADSAHVQASTFNPALGLHLPTSYDNNPEPEPEQASTFNSALGLHLPTASNHPSPAQGQISTFNSALGLHLPVGDNGNNNNTTSQQRQTSTFNSALGLHLPTPTASMQGQTSTFNSALGLHLPAPSNDPVPMQGQTSTFNSALGLHLPSNISNANNTSSATMYNPSLGLHLPVAHSNLSLPASTRTSATGLHLPSPTMTNRPAEATSRPAHTIVDPLAPRSAPVAAPADDPAPAPAPASPDSLFGDDPEDLELPSSPPGAPIPSLADGEADAAPTGHM